MSDLVWFLEKSTLNPDLPYNRLLYKRFLLYYIGRFRDAMVKKGGDTFQTTY